MTDTSLAIDFISKLVKQRYEDDSSQQVPMIFAFKDGQVGAVIQLDFDDDEKKIASINEAARHLRQQGMDASVFVSEAWMVEQPANEPSVLVRPRDSERRIEVLILEASAKDQHTSVIYKIERNWTNGNFLGLTEFQRHDSVDGDGTSVTSRFDFFN